MDRETRDKWVVALKSGLYKQGESFLKRDGRYCCLGVLCEVTNPPGWDPAGGEIKYVESSDGENEEYADDQELPFVTLDHFELSTDQAGDLMDMNDCLGKSFPEIADWIEANI